MHDLTEKRKVLVGVSGSIAAYKSAELVRILVTRGYEVKVVMTKSAQEFITPMTLEAVSGQPVMTDLFDGSESEIGHIKLADWADAMVIAPATANTIAKLTWGLADDALTATALACKKPIMVCPAMNTNMFENQATQENIEVLRKRGVVFVDPEEGSLACGWEGSGRLADPWEIFHHIRKTLTHQDFAGRHVLITTGPTREPLDPVRFISNRSSGKMGTSLAREAFRRGARVTLVHGPVYIKVPAPVQKVAVETAEDMAQAVKAQMTNNEDPVDIVIMAAAVADFRPKQASDSKLKKASNLTKIDLQENPDILAELGAARQGDKPLLVGFAVETGETEELIAEVRRKMETKRADMIIGNLALEALDSDTNRVWILDRNGKQEEVATTFKSRVANKILDAILKL